MAIKPVNTHYSMENPATIFDEESLTALQLAARTTAKVNETVEAFNQLEAETDEHLQQQDETIEKRMKTQDDRIAKMNDVTMPAEVKAECQRLIEAGEFDAAINLYLDNLNERVNNLLGSVSEGSTTLDAEVIDARVDVNGTTHDNAGSAIRSQLKGYYQTINHGCTKIIPSAYDSYLDVTLDNGTVTAKYTKPDTQPNYAGFGFTLGKKVSQLAGKRILVVFDNKFNGLGVNLSDNGYQWANAVNFQKLTETEYYLDVTGDMSEQLGEYNVYICFKINSAFDFETTATPYITDLNTDGGNMAKTAYYAHHFNTDIPVSTANRADSAGFFYIPSDKPSAYEVVKNGGYAAVNNNEMTVVVENTTGSPAYTTCGVLLNSVKDRIRYIYIAGDQPTNLCLTRTVSNWSSLIAHLNLGMNDVRELNLANEGTVALTIGQYGSVGKKTIRYYLIGANNEVFATKYIGDDRNDFIVCWGDSLTAGGGWTSRLAELSGRPVYNAGTGGENVKTIMARQGADVMIVNNITIPADKTAVQIATYADKIDTAFGLKATPLLQGGSHVNPVKIGDVVGTLAWTGSSYNDTSGVWTFTRKEEGEAVTIDRPTAMTTAYDREKNAPYLMIIFMGQNGGYDSNEDLVNMHRQMIDHANAQHVVILGLSTGTADSRGAYETAMRYAFGRYFISLREYLSKYGLADAGLTATDEDTAAMAIGQVPPQLLADGVHYTAACKTVIGDMLYKKCCELNIF